MKKYNVAIVFVLILLWVTTQSINCRRPIPQNYCSNYKQDSVLLKMDVVNQAATFTLADTIKVYAKISDTINPLLSSSFIYPLNGISANVQVFKVVPNGSTYQLNYANIEFNVNLQTGTFQQYQGVGYYLLYNRTQPFNELQFSLKPGVVGLYAIVIEKNYSGTYIRNPNDDCVSFISIPTFNAAKQNLQYWSTLGLNSLSLGNSNNNIFINKNDKNYFFVKIIP